MSPLRTTTKLLRLSPDELAAITERAHRSGQTPARFIREAALGLKPRVLRGAPQDDVLRQLGRIASTLKQFAREAHGDDHLALHARIETVLTELAQAVRRLG